MLLAEDLTNISRRKDGLSCRCYNLQNVKALQPFIHRVSEARNTAHGDWKQPPEGDGTLKWMEWMEEKRWGWGEVSGRQRAPQHCPSPAWGLDEERRDIGC